MLPWSEYKYQKLSIQLCNIFQDKMSKLVNGLEYGRTYIHNLLIISNSNFEDQLNKLKTNLKKLNAYGFKINTQKSIFAKNSLEYLGFKITREALCLYQMK